VFSHVGWGELALLAIVGLVIFGPDRLPKVMKDGARLLRELRTMARGAAADLRAELGPEMAELDLASLHPRRLVSSFLDDEPDVSPSPAPSPAPVEPAQLAVGETPPYDVDAT
jgi:sec-independent protein translocase protein TatB